MKYEVKTPGSVERAAGYGVAVGSSALITQGINLTLAHSAFIAIGLLLCLEVLLWVSRRRANIALLDMYIDQLLKPVYENDRPHGSDYETWKWEFMKDKPTQRFANTLRRGAIVGLANRHLPQETTRVLRYIHAGSRL